MRNLLALLALLILSFAGLGAWRGWYGISNQPADAGKLAFRIEIDTIKVGSDFAEMVRSLGQRVYSSASEEAKEGAEK
jgi:hypothetical protein